MENIVLQTQGITVKYGNFLALENVSIELKEKHIYGFIGENGAGKTTLMKVLTGLLYPTSGKISLFGKDTQNELLKMRRHIGSTIENPALYPEYSVWRNIELQRILVGNPDKEICDELLDMVGLLDVRNNKVKKLSMGMKQRLSIAITLVGNPKLLILDEPINGLDPKNISDLRILLKKLNEDNGVTLFISSHILSELYMIATDYYIIHKGKIIEALTQDELEERCRKYIKIKSSDISKCIAVIKNEFKDIEYNIIDDETVHLFDFTDQSERLAKLFLDNQIVTKELMIAEQSLEEYFLLTTRGDHCA